MLYKLLHDALFVMLIFFMLALLAEGLLPGIVSSHFALYKIALLIIGDILAVFGLRKAIGITTEGNLGKKLIYPFLFLMLLLLFNSMTKINIFLNLFILACILSAVYFIAKVLRED